MTMFRACRRPLSSVCTLLLAATFLPGCDDAEAVPPETGGAAGVTARAGSAGVSPQAGSGGGSARAGSAGVSAEAGSGGISQGGSGGAPTKGGSGGAPTKGGSGGAGAQGGSAGAGAQGGSAGAGDQGGSAGAAAQAGSGGSGGAGASAGAAGGSAGSGGAGAAAGKGGSAGKGGGAGIGSGGGSGSAGGPGSCPGPLSPASGPIPASVVTFVGSDGVQRGVDATEVTAAQFEPFRASLVEGVVEGTGACADAPLQIIGDASCRPDRPLYASFCTAKAFCAWGGKALCGATDWTQACTNGGTTTFSTGSALAPSCRGPQLHDATQAAACHGASAPLDAVYDLSGNLPEWTDECVDIPAWQGGGQRCRVRGGGSESFNLPDEAARLDCASDGDSATATDFFPAGQLAGFRCCEPPVCTPGQTRSCYSGTAGTLGVGLCHAGVETCLPDGTGYGSCTGEIVPTAEICATEGDDDCDGSSNEGGADCVCTPGAVSLCYGGAAATKGVGDCQGGSQICNAAGDGYGACTGQVVPQAETCSAPGDENCNGAANELGGVGCVCVPGAISPCYEGPAGTEEVGLCHGGTQTCLATGAGYGACGDQVVPAPAQSCGNHVDDDCDGFADEQGEGQPCSFGTAFSRSFGTNSYSTIDGLAIDDLGHVIVGGSFDNTLDFGGGVTLTESNNAFEGYVAAFDAAGAHLWSHKTPGPPVGIVRVNGGIIAASLVFVVGTGSGGGGSGGGSGGGIRPAAEVRRLTLTGATDWATQVSAPDGDVVARGVAAMPDGGAVILASFRGTITLGGSTLTSGGDGKGGGGADLVVARFGPTGAPIWARQLRGWAEGSGIPGIAVDGTGAVHVALTAQGTIDLGDPAAEPFASQGGGLDVCLAKLSPGGAYVSGRCFGDASEQRLSSLAVDAAGNVAIFGRSLGLVDFGLGPLEPPADPQINGGFLARFDAAGAATSVARVQDVLGSAFRGNELILATRAGILALGTDSKPRSAFLISGGFGSPFFLPTPSGAVDVYIGGAFNQTAQPDLGQGPIAGGEGVSAGAWARVPLP